MGEGWRGLGDILLWVRGCRSEWEWDSEWEWEWGAAVVGDGGNQGVVKGILFLVYAVQGDPFHGILM